MKNPYVSICLLSYNREHLLRSTIDSLLAQDLTDFELIISDDASTDGSLSVCKEYAQRDSRVSYCCNADRLGMPGNLNHAIGLARGVFVANLHDGDIYRRDMLSKCCKLLERYADAAFVFNEYESRGRSGNPITPVYDFPERFEVGELTRFMLQALRSPVWGTVVARKACYDFVGPFNPRFSWFSDVEMWMRLNLSFAVAYVREPLMLLSDHELDRPYACIDWSHERILVAMYEEVIQTMYSAAPVQAAAARRTLRSIRNRRWLYQLCCLIKQSRMDQVDLALSMFREEDSALLRLIGITGPLAFPFMRLKVGQNTLPQFAWNTLLRTVLKARAE